MAWRGRIRNRYTIVFQLTEQSSGRVLSETLEIHILELARYNLEERDLAAATQLECWIFWLLHAHEYESEDLLSLFPDTAIQQATQSLTTIKSKTDEKAMYDSREKAIRDYQWRIDVAREEGEAKGEAKGILIGRINTLESILNLPETDEDLLRKMPLEDLKLKLAELQQAIQDRQ